MEGAMDETSQSCIEIADISLQRISSRRATDSSLDKSWPCGVFAIRLAV